MVVKVDAGFDHLCETLAQMENVQWLGGFMLPYPPSVNRYWRHNRGRTHISKQGREYREEVVLQAMADDFPWKLQGRLMMFLLVYPPDRRQRDLDNVCKAVLDAMEHAGVYESDSQIDSLHIVRRPVIPRGGVTVFLAKFEEEC